MFEKGENGAPFFKQNYHEELNRARNLIRITEETTKCLQDPNFKQNDLIYSNNKIYTKPPFFKYDEHVIEGSLQLNNLMQIICNIENEQINLICEQFYSGKIKQFSYFRLILTKLFIILGVVFTIGVGLSLFMYIFKNHLK